MKYWLFKSEPDAFSIDDLAKKPKKTEHWDGVRNYQARNMMRDEIKKGDLVLFYHSNCKPPGVVGIAEVVKESYPDFTSYDDTSKYYDPKSTPENPRWFMVNVKFVEKFPRMIPLDEIREHKDLQSMLINRKGNRLSITPVTKKEFTVISKLGQK